MKRQFVAMVAIVVYATMAAAQQSSAPSSMTTAQAAARWIQSTAIKTDTGVVWPADSNDPKSVNTSLYAGTPGPILFFLESYRYTKKADYLDFAKRGADALLASAKKEDPTGLYEGLAGTGFTLGEMYLVTRDEKYRKGALQCAQWIMDRAKPSGKGVEWDQGNDIIAGAAGTGLFLLWADKNLQAPGARATAIAAGQHLLEIGQPQGDGKTKWMMDDKFPREMPNFAHGTAGIAYFFATLYRETRQQQFLDAAKAGANYLISIADKQGDICMIYHDDENKNLYYLSWCHGPAGTARLFYRLYQITNDPQWMTWMKRSASALIQNDVPNKAVTPGEWDNISACCGTTAQAEFFLDMYLLTHDRQYLELARKGTARLLSDATMDSHGARWVQAEHRTKPDLRVAQTGFMQGASGVGMWLLHFGEFSAGTKLPAIVFPDNPFTY
jgi:lantibiotic modifying enzyme